MSDLFQIAIKTCFDNWTALQLAVVHGFGGSDTKEKADMFMSDTYQWMMDNEDIEDFELEAYFEDTMNVEFNSILDDGSALVLARRLVKYFQQFKSGQFDELKADLEAHYINCSNIPKVNSSIKQSNDDSSSDEEDDDNNDEMMEQDEEGEEEKKSGQAAMTAEEQENFEKLEEGWTFVAKHGKQFTK